ncbi:dTDP-4-amino-4,6-dideoxygalactose transaminase [Phaeodactylibacter xiamenensis]|uniref:dTDP-4-amino-4,6-dideoxygalactose transaminase n=1 Tax=Phaeodactylibacter xiamenensis TaxID=1524460 RepID=UPI003CCC19B3
MNIPFNKPFIGTQELKYIEASLQNSRLSGDGEFTKRCHQWLEEQYGFPKTFLTTSCTHALEMAALLTEIQPGDEVIMPSYTFVSTANAFMLRGAKIVFADSQSDHPNIDVSLIERHITPKTKVIIPVHYAGVGCDMDALNSIAKKNNIWVVEDAAQAIHATYKGKALGSLGDLGCFSFHDTKNIICGEGGFISINRPEVRKRGEILREKGTNRAAFYRGEIDKYGWVDVGSSYLPSDVLAAFLLAQLEAAELIQEERMKRWQYYYTALSTLEKRGELSLPLIPAEAKHNAHVFYLVLPNGEKRDALMYYLRERGIQAPFHYLALHQSMYFKNYYKGPALPNSVKFTDCLIRLPLFVELSTEQQDRVIQEIYNFFG